MTRRLEELIRQINDGFFSMHAWATCAAGHCARLADATPVTEEDYYRVIRNVLDLKYTTYDEIEALVFERREYSGIGDSKVRVTHALREMCHQDDVRGELYAKQIAKAKANNGGRITLEEFRQEGWYTDEGGEGVQSSGQEEFEFEDA